MSKKERFVMKAVLEVCKGKEACLASPNEFLKAIPYNIDISRQEFDEKLKQLEYDGYIGLTLSDKKGDPIYCIDLTTKGMGFDREMLQRRRAIRFKVILAVAAAVITFVVGRVLVWIFQ